MIKFLYQILLKRLHQKKRITIFECPFQTEYTLLDISKKYFVKNILHNEFKILIFPTLMSSYVFFEKKEIKESAVDK